MKLIRRERLGEQLFELPRRNILSGQIPVGRRLVQGEFAAEMGVSRLPVRDALKRLTPRTSSRVMNSTATP